MRGRNGKDKFQERLDRLKEESAPPRPAWQTPPSTKLEPPKHRQSNGKVIAGLLGLGLVAGVGLYLMHMASQSLHNLPAGELMRTAAANTLAKTPVPADYSQRDSRGPDAPEYGDIGWTLPPQFVATPEGGHLPFDLLITATATPAETPRPEVVKFAANDTCSLRKPRATETLRSVRLHNSSRGSDVHVFSNEDLADAVSKRIEGIIKHPKNYKNASVAKGRMGLVDVFVTDTSAPVYLLLHSFDKDILWNVHLAKGASLAHVALVGNKSAFTAPDGNYSYEALRITDHVHKDTFFDNTKSRPCMIVPFNEPREDWPAFAKAQKPHSGHYQRVLRDNTDGHREFRRWYTEQLGVDTDHNLTTATEAAHALAGPVPAEPLPYQPYFSQAVRMMDSDNITFSIEEFRAAHTDLLNKATGGDLSILTPLAMERVFQ